MRSVRLADFPQARRWPRAALNSWAKALEIAIDESRNTLQRHFVVRRNGQWHVYRW